MIKYDDDKEEVFKIEIYIGGKEGTEISVSRPIIYEEGCPKLITPYDARMRNLTYETHIFAEVFVCITSKDEDKQNIETVSFKNVAVGSIPIMLHSDICILKNQGSSILSKLGECPYDTGGYFIIDGKEKVIIAQEKIVTTKYQKIRLKGIEYYESLTPASDGKYYIYDESMVGRVRLPKPVGEVKIVNGKKQYLIKDKKNAKAKNKK
jgi:DNA-directed RNA polymerase beta subunit